MEEVGVGGCTLTERRVQPWHAPFPHRLLLPPPTGRAFSRGAAAGLRPKFMFLHAGSPSSPYLSSQAFPAPSPPRDSWEPTDPPQAPSSPVSIYKILRLRLPAARRGEVRVYTLTVCCLQSWRDLLTLRASVFDQPQFLSSGLCSEVLCNHKIFSQNLSFP